MNDTIPHYTPADWYWIIGGDESRYWSSAAGAYIDELPEDAGVTRIASEAELNDVLAVYGLPGPLVTIANVVAERDRRLSLGFDFDFGDERGVHHIGTTPDDMIGWNAVTVAANAIIATRMRPAAIDILTETGPATVTAMEWQQVLLAATAAQQPIWHASFALSAMSPIPANFRNDAHWQ